MTNQQLELCWKEAKQLQKNSYAPYSKFRVAAILTMNDGQKITGVNIENAAYPATMCAERVALSHLIAIGLNPEQIASLFLITDSKTLGSPCGICRQVMAELMPAHTPIYVSNATDASLTDIKKFTVAALLPFAFLPKALTKEK